MRTTIDIDDAVLKELKRLQRIERKSLGLLVSDLLAESLSERRSSRPPPAPFEWTSKRMGARVDLTDKHALMDALDAGEA